MAWFKDGSIAVTNGSKTATLSGAATTGNIYAGDALVGPDGKDYEIASVTNATTFQLIENYAGTTASGQAYKVKPIAVVDTLRQATATLASVSASYASVRDNQGQGLFTDLVLKPRKTDNTATFASHMELARGDGSGTVASIRSRGDAANGVDLVDFAFGGSTRFNIDKYGTANLVSSDASRDAQFSQNRPSGTVGTGIGRQSAFAYDAGATYRNYGYRQFEINSNTSGNPGGRHAIAIAKEAAGGVALAEMLVGDEHRLFGTAPFYSWYNQAGTSRYGYVQHDGSELTISNDVSTGVMRFMTNAGFGPAERMRIDAAGNLLVGLTSAPYHKFYTGVGGNGSAMFAVADSNGETMCILSASGLGPSSAGAAMWIKANGATGRSINAGGTVNVGGADYAEYHRKSEGCGVVAKGQIVGLNGRREIVDTFAEALRFKIKSTDPNLVGGDRWAQHLGPRPEPPAALATADDFAAYESALADFDAALEAERVWVDRLAYAGQVPAAVSGDVSEGDYVVAEEGPEGSIQAVCVALPTDAQRRQIVGWVAIANPTETDLRNLVGANIAPDPAWTAIVDVMQG